LLTKDLAARPESVATKSEAATDAGGPFVAASPNSRWWLFEYCDIHEAYTILIKLPILRSLVSLQAQGMVVGPMLDLSGIEKSTKSVWRPHAVISETPYSIRYARSSWSTARPKKNQPAQGRFEEVIPRMHRWLFGD
jgi:hypothetical protein